MSNGTQSSHSQPHFKSLNDASHNGCSNASPNNQQCSPHDGQHCSSPQIAVVIKGGDSPNTSAISSSSNPDASSLSIASNLSKKHKDNLCKFTTSAVLSLRTLARQVLLLQRAQNSTRRPIEYKTHRSGESAMYSFVRFVNRTERKVDVVWLNYEGIGVHYRTLKPGHCVDVNTFVGHPWVFRDSDTGDKLVVQLKEVFEPVGWRPRDGWPPKRRLVNITIPVFSLRECCLQAVRRTIRRDLIPRLEIPTVLKEDLLELNPMSYSCHSQTENVIAHS